MIRLPVQLVDRLMTLAGELVLVRNQALRTMDTAAEPDEPPARPFRGDPWPSRPLDTPTVMLDRVEPEAPAWPVRGLL